MGGSEPSLLCGLREKAGPFFLDCVCSGSEAPTSTTVCPCDQPQHSGVDGPSRPGDPWSESVGQGQEGGSSVPGVTLHTLVPRVPPTVPAAPAWRKNTAVHGRCAVRACRCPLPLAAGQTGLCCKQTPRGAPGSHPEVSAEAGPEGHLGPGPAVQPGCGLAAPGRGVAGPTTMPWCVPCLDVWFRAAAPGPP